VTVVAQPGREQIRRLARAEVAEGCVLSVYVDLDPREFATGPARQSALTSAADEAAKAVEARRLSHEVRLALREDVERIRAYAGEADFDGTHGLAIFAAGPERFEALHLPRRVPSGVWVGAAPHVAPLVGEPNGSWCVALVNRRDARLLLGGPLRLAEVERITDDVPGRHDQGGLAQARYERHIDEQARRHLERVAGRVGELRRSGRFDHLLVGGPDEPHAEFCALLDRETAALECGRVSVDFDAASETDVTAAAEPAMRACEARQRTALLDRVDEGLGPDGHAAAGVDEVLGCLNEQRVATVLLDDGLAGEGAWCPACGWLTASAAERCPADGSQLRGGADLVEAIVDRALLQDADVLRLRDDDRIAGHGGVAAVLRF